MGEIPLLTNECFHPFNGVFQKISNLIKDFNSDHPEEMLPKLPDELEKIYRDGRSVIAIDSKSETVIGHAALYPLLDVNIGGTNLKLGEFGSWIVNPEYRHHRINGLSIGEAIAQELISKYPDLPIIATVKRLNSFQGLQKIGFSPLNFYELPFIAALTCVCQNSSEHFGYQCHHRRREDYGLKNGLIEIKFQITNNNEPPKIPCTLLGHNLPALTELNENLRQLIIGNQPENDLPFIFAATENFFRN